MNLTHTCIVTENVERLCSFYQDLLQIEPQIYGEDYVEFITERGILSLYSLTGQELLAPGSITPASNHSVMLAFQVDDVDKEYQRLQEMKIEWVKSLTTQPWGERFTYFRDPDGNLISFYSLVQSPPSS